MLRAYYCVMTKERQPRGLGRPFRLSACLENHKADIET